MFIRPAFNNYSIFWKTTSTVKTLVIELVTFTYHYSGFNSTDTFTCN